MTFSQSWGIWDIQQFSLACEFLSDPGVPGPIYGSVCLSLNKSLTIPGANLTDVTLADEDTNSILTDNANRTIQGNILQCK